MSKLRQLKNVAHDFEVAVGDVGVTVRLGAKWQVAGTGEVVELWRCDTPHDDDCPETFLDDNAGRHDLCAQQGHGKILGWWTGAFEDLPVALVAIEHEAACRHKIKALYASMVRAYGSDAFKSDSIVTALIYSRIDE